MVTKVKITDSNNTPIPYLPDVKALYEGREFEFKPGVNIIVGKNGCGKSTLLRLIKNYLLVEYETCGLGQYNSVINKVMSKDMDNCKVLDGVDVFADYDKNTFNLTFRGDNANRELFSHQDARSFFCNVNCSNGEGVLESLSNLFNIAFSNEAPLKFDYTNEKLQSFYPSYIDYVNSHKVECADCYTFLLDEPDNNLDLEHIDEIYGILSYDKPQTQLIAVIHNPILIYKLLKVKYINFIELTEGYLDIIRNTIDNLNTDKNEKGRKRRSYTR